MNIPDLPDDDSTVRIQNGWVTQGKPENVEEYFFAELERISSGLIWTEVAALAMHDLFHSFSEVHAYSIDIRERLSANLSVPEALKCECQSLNEAIDSLGRQITMLRNTLQFKMDSTSSQEDTFIIVEEIDNVLNLVRAGLSKHKIKCNVSVDRDLHLRGPRQAFTSVILNIVFNTLDAAARRTKTRPMSINFQAFCVQKTVRLRIWDSGPGINVHAIGGIDRLFALGTTTKSGGMGIGLALARRMFQSHFLGTISLVSAKPPVFELRCRLAD